MYVYVRARLRVIITHFNCAIPYISELLIFMQGSQPTKDALALIY